MLVTKKISLKEYMLKCLAIDVRVLWSILGYPLCVSHIGMTYGGSPSKGRERGIYLSPRPGNLIPGISLVLKMTRNVELSLIDYSII